MSSKNVLYPLWRSQQHISGVLRRDILQEIRSLVVRLLLQSLRRLSTVLVGIIQPLLWQLLFGTVREKLNINRV